MNQGPYINQTPAQAGYAGNGYAATPASDLDFISQERSAEEFRKAQRHAKRVKLLKLVLPIVGVMIILAVAAALIIRQVLLPDLDIGEIALQDGKLVMENPNLNGLDKEKRPFSLSAAKAIQDSDQPKRVELVSIDARLPMDDTVFADVKAGNGIYDAEDKTLVLTKTVNVVTSDGMVLTLQDADVDIDEGSLVTLNPIVATSQKADISSQSLKVEDNGKRLVFEGTVRMTLRPDELKKTEE